MVKDENITKGIYLCQILNEDIPKHEGASAVHITRQLPRQRRNAQTVMNKNCNIGHAHTAASTMAAQLSPLRKPNKLDAFR